MPEARVNGIRLYYEEHGEGAPILCIHGSGSSAIVWGDAVEQLARHGRVIAYDRRGCSRSQRPEPYERTSAGEQADDAAALIDALAAAPAMVIGRSYGGGVAIELALRHPDRVRALVLLEPDSLGLSPHADEWNHALADRLRAAAAQDGVGAVGEALITEVLGADGWASFPEELQRLFTDNGEAILAEVHFDGLHHGEAALATIEQPVLLVAASESPPEFRRMTEALAEAIPTARASMVGGGHLIDPAGQDVLDFVDQVVAGR